ncbi:tumor necrosis factor receptor superfamily member 5-like isoform X4 [Carcharodon carcharias]|uniref:tumor necrosis factor receptor superfamily member 5-like isoform X4 n=1 Tax=Carcharodon carcharias TaxID=13397 RepID=UPI001B7EDD40|nr:tumor necrosis factor receptor superfamily member 5-like isoform X4 [Carcharodon carcharias]
MNTKTFQQLQHWLVHKCYQICFILLLVHYLQVVVCCGQGEYTINGQCCSMCSPGTIVLNHCTTDFGTVCKPCTTGEYIDHPNGLEKCFKCAACDQGTDFTDTVCELCPEGTYSGTDSSTEACEKWTNCKERNQNQVKLGTSSTDTICGTKTNLVTILVPVVITVLIIACAVVFIWKRNRRHPKHEDALASLNHDLPSIKRSEVGMFADDCTMFSTICDSSDIGKVRVQMQQDLENIQAWADKWRSS